MVLVVVDVGVDVGVDVDVVVSQWGDMAGGVVEVMLLAFPWV
jgi:hypothetical protein